MSNDTGYETQQLEAQQQQIQTALNRLRNQLGDKQKELKESSDCYERLVSAKNNLNTILEDTFSVIQSRLLLDDSRVRILNRSYQNAKAKLGDSKIADALGELDYETTRVAGRIDNVEGEIQWLQMEISRKEGALWEIAMRQGE